MHTQVNTQTNDTGRSVANNAAKGGISLPAVSITGDNAVQRVITNNADGEEITDYDLDSIDYYVAVYLDEQINQLRVWSADAEDNAKIQAVLEAGPPGFGGAASAAKAGSPKSRKGKEPATEEAAFVPSSLAEKEKEKQIKVYLELIDHLAGEGGGKTALTGGHLLSEMKKKYGKGLRISGEPNPNAPWEGWWTDGKAEPKWSSFFPSGWSKAQLLQALRLSSTVRGGRELPGGITITKTGDTFYPWVGQTLDKPAIKDMRPAP